MSRRLVLLIVLSSFLSLSLGGCAGIQKALGLKVDLEDKPVKKLELDVVGTSSLCPGLETPIIVTAVLDDGERLASEGAGDGKVTWDNYKIKTTGGEMVKEGVFALDADPRATAAQPARLEVRSSHHKKLKVNADIPARYDCDFTADFSGRAGRDGAHGQPGSRGRDGADKQSSESYAEPGGHGEPGGNGSHGADGEPGEDAEDVEVFVKLVETEDPDSPLLQVLVDSMSSDHTEIFLVNPNGGQLTVLANGGRGGHGGDGGNGGTGGGGGTGEPAGNGGPGGNGGDGGNGAPGGNGGNVKMIVDTAAKDYIEAVVIENNGGPGGQPGHAGSGGSGGSAFSGGQQGSSGDRGRDGTRSGRDGRPGPRPELVYEDVAELW